MKYFMDYLDQPTALPPFIGVRCFDCSRNHKACLFYGTGAFPCRGGAEKAPFIVDQSANLLE